MVVYLVVWVVMCVINDFTPTLITSNSLFHLLSKYFYGCLLFLGTILSMEIHEEDIWVKSRGFNGVGS